MKKKPIIKTTHTMKITRRELSKIAYELEAYDHEDLRNGITVEWTYRGQKKIGHTDYFEGDVGSDELERYVLANANEII